MWVLMWMLFTRASARATSEALFSPTSFHSVNLEIDPRALSDMQADPVGTRSTYGDVSLKKTHVACNLTIGFGTPEAKVFLNVDCSYEGHGTLLGCVDPETGALSERRPPHYPRNVSSYHDFGCRRVGWEVAVGASADSLIYGMERLRFHGMTWGDASLMRERLAHQTLHDLGMLISRVAGALLHVNGVEYGIFNLVEVIDEPFLKSRGLQGTLMWEAWMAYTDARSYDDKIVVGPRDSGAAQPLVDLRLAAEACLRNGCDEASARTIVQNYTVEHTWLDALFGLCVFYNFDGFVSFWVDVGPHNFGIFIDSRTPNQLTMIPWDYSEALRVVPQFEDSGWERQLFGGAQPLGLYGIGASFNPPWFYLPTQAERQTLCNVRNPAGVTHFTCDPVGHVMTIAWRRVFFDYIRKYLRTDMSAIPPVSVLQQANRYASLWSGQYRPSVERQSSAGGLPKLEDFNRGPVIALQMLASGLTELSTQSATPFGGVTGWTDSSLKATRTVSMAVGTATFPNETFEFGLAAVVLAFTAGAVLSHLATRFFSSGPRPLKDSLLYS